MKENEDNFDDLLNLLGEEEKDSFEEGGAFDLSELMDNGNIEESVTAMGTEEKKRPLSTLEQLMAEMESESQASGVSLFEDASLLAEDSIDALLENAKNTSDEYLENNTSYEMSDDVDMAEIEALLNMSDNNDLVDEDEAFLRALNNMNQETVDYTDDIPEEEVMELDPAELDALLSADQGSSESSTEDDGTSLSVGNNSQGTEEGSGNTSPKKKKKEKKEGSGLFKKLFSLLMEEYPEEEEPKEAGSLNLSDENKAILTQLDKEKGKKKKEKKEKKGKKGKENKEGKSKKPEKPKKEKKPKVKKEKKKKEKLPEKPEKRLPKKKVIVTFIFAFSILAAILMLEFIVPPMFSLSAARTFFDDGDYRAAYLEYYGKKLSEEDELKFQGATVIMRMQSNLDGYHNYLAIDEEVMAVHSLLEGVNVRTDIFAKAEAYGVTSEVNRVYGEILNLLSANYGISEQDAIALTEIESDVTYTKELGAIVEGSFVPVEQIEEPSEDVVVEEIIEGDLLPEELELLQEGE